MNEFSAYRDHVGGHFVTACWRKSLNHWGLFVLVAMPGCIGYAEIPGPAQGPTATAARQVPGTHEPLPHNTTASFMGPGKYLGAPGVGQDASGRAGDEITIWVDLFKAQLARKEFAKARASAKKIIALSPASADTYNHLGAMQAEAGDFRGAIENLEKARGFRPHSYEILYNLGLAHYRAGDVTRSLQILESLRVRQNSAELENLLGEVYEKNGQYLAAVQAFQNASAREPGSEAYRFDYIHELLLHHTFDVAIVVAERATRDFPDSLKVRLALGVGYFGRGRFARALETFLEAAREFPDAMLPLYFSSLVADTTGQDVEEVDGLVAAYSRRRPKEFWPHYFLGRAAYRNELKRGASGEFERPVRLLMESIKLAPNYPDAHYELGNVYSQLKRWQAAIREYKTAVRLKPELAEAHYRLAQAYRQVGDLEQAESEFGTHRKLRQQETEEHLRKREVNRFLYELRR